MKRLWARTEGDRGAGGDVADIHSAWDTAYYWLFALVVLVGLLTFRDYGYSWDEAWQNRWYGQTVIGFLKTLGGDQRAVTDLNFHLYGGTFDVLAEALVAVSPFEPRNARHLANLMAGLLGLWGTWKTARLAVGPLAAFWAALFLVTSAPFYGHLFINAKDIPFAAGYIWSLYLLLRMAPHLPRPPLKDRCLFALATGFTLGVRVGGVLLLGYYVLIGVFHLLAARRRDEGRGGSRALEFVRGFIPVAGVSYLLMLTFWPAALLSPLAHPLAALRATNHFVWGQHVLWNGRLLPSTDLPWNYLPVLMGVELPEVLVVLLCLALPWALFRLFRALRHGDPAGSAGLGLLSFAALFPPLWAVVSRATLYDNMRHFIFVLPPLMVMAGMAFSSFLDRVERYFAGGRRYAVILVVGALAWSVAQMASLHPYEYTYLNSFAGGIPAGGERFETDYWLTSYQEAATIVEEHARKVAAARGIPFEESRFSVALVASPHNLLETMPQQFKLYEFDYVDSADYLVATTRWKADRRWPDYPVIGTVGRRGMTFAVVKVSPRLASLVSRGGAEKQETL